MTTRWLPLSMLLCASFALACSDEAAETSDMPNPFLEDQSNLSKEDTQYVNPDGIEVEVDLEADISASSWQLDDAPALLGQFAVTYMRKRSEFYMESLAEDSTSSSRVEWRVDNVWIPWSEAKKLDSAKLTHFRIRGVNTVLLHSDAKGVKEGDTYIAKVPKNPFTVMSDVGDKCAEKDGHIDLSSSVYWYLWAPGKSACPAAIQQEMVITVSKLMPKSEVTYPEYDKLVADGKVTAVVFFGQIGDGAISDSDIGMRGFRQMASWLKEDGFSEATDAPVGKRFSKVFSGVTFEIDLYSPKEFSGLSDMGNYKNFERGIQEHEIVVYDGHSMLGASDFWAKPEYPQFYQIFLYGGCLGYEYYIRPILAGKGGWANLDLLSSVVEVSAGANEFAGPFFAKFAWALEHNYNVSWKDMLIAIRKSVGDSTFGMSGIRENCFSPAGSLCQGEQPPAADAVRVEAKPEVAVPDDAPAGTVSTLEVPAETAGNVSKVTLELDVSHTYVGDLVITLSHDGVDVVVWDQAGGSGQDIKQNFVLIDFAETPKAGAWTLRLVDTYGLDTGTLNSWAITVE